MELLLLALLLGALLFTIILLFQMQRSLRERDAYEAEVARQNAEQLRSSLDQKVTLSMSVVSDRLQQVSRSLGTLQSLSQNVGDLKKVMGNVKNRGIWGEMQLARLLSDMLAPDQYGTNVAIRPRSQERVALPSVFPGRMERRLSGFLLMQNCPKKITCVFWKPVKRMMKMPRSRP